MHRSDLARAAAALVLSSVEGFAEAEWPKVFWPWKQATFPLGTPRENLLRSGSSHYRGNPKDSIAAP